MSTDALPLLAFIAAPDEPAIEIRANFGVFAGRAVMLSEIDRLAAWLLDEVDAITVIAEERHEIGRTGEGSVHQVRIELSQEQVPAAASEREELERRLLERVDYWLRLCIAEREGDSGA
jgi:hypothetical protein